MRAFVDSLRLPFSLIRRGARRSFPGVAGQDSLITGRRCWPTRRQSGNRKVAYTFIFGDYDDLKAPSVITPGWDYICFTDDSTLRSDVWDVRLSPRRGSDRQLEHKKFAMKHMILAHQFLSEYDLSLSVGAQMELNCDLDGLMEEQLRSSDDMMICVHPDRDCIYDEARVCKSLMLDDPKRIDAHMKRYRTAGYPENNGLFATGIIARWHNRPNVRSMCELWWKEYRNGSRRDQLSLNYAIWRSQPIKLSAVEHDQLFTVRRNFIPHSHKRRIRFDGTQMSIRPDHAEVAFSPQSTLSVTGDQRYTGHIDHVSPDLIVGWAADRHRPGASINVSVYDGDALLGGVRADELRPDVGAHLGDDGRHGFLIPIPLRLLDGAPHRVHFKFDDNESTLLQINDFIARETEPSGAVRSPDHRSNPI
jgi:hypothetical protein